MLKGQCHLFLQEYAAAAKEFKLFLGRNFAKDDPNYLNRKEVYYYLAQALLAMKEENKAQEALEAAQKITLKGDKALQANIATLLKEINGKRREPASAK